MGRRLDADCTAPRLQAQTCSEMLRRERLRKRNGAESGHPGACETSLVPWAGNPEDSQIHACRLHKATSQTREACVGPRGLDRRRRLGPGDAGSDAGACWSSCCWPLGLEDMGRDSVIVDVTTLPESLTSDFEGFQRYVCGRAANGKGQRYFGPSVGNREGRPRQLVAGSLRSWRSRCGDASEARKRRCPQSPNSSHVWRNSIGPNHDFPTHNTDLFRINSYL
ncbi:hypothetical protein BDK51DRAFT_50122 [Blyttiomyces helicus]|uniref:Uncharacterized protein n=1 Tax=Blyttiomyces helicus TaxID=388810 RepID=A0A4P9VTC6_9FUNG|nr:hypothetical protein BDK51DRAFT_50122 [Blyttiomyces helicus]|eukprot:RKO82771.1 hypothetical protein BDK51DRAFT_50122 [Blyttiomyces helicus]